ncbi:MAG: glycosyltransferase family 4 protein [Nitrospirae bacterium]|nr:glycosyltransferase family 4 protein [Nitrospirota bacterium]
MKIRFVTPWYGEFAGGAEFAARRLAENLCKADVDAGVLTTCCRTPFDDWWSDYYAPGRYEANGVSVIRFPVNKESSDLYHQINYKIINGLPILREDELNFIRGSINSHGLISHIKSNRDCIYVFIPYLYGPTFWGVNAAPERSIIIPCLHDEAAAKLGIMKEAFSKAKALIFLSEKERSLARRLYDLDVANMPAIGIGVDTDIDPCAARFRDKYNIRGQFILYAGRKDRGKNIIPLVEYFRRYTELYGMGVKLVFIGGGDASLVPHNDPRFTDLSYVPQQDKYDAMAASLAVCNLSENESFSFVIMESWLTGRPVIVSSKGWVTKGHCERAGGGIPVGSKDEFCNSLKQLVDNEDIAIKMGQNGRGYVFENYTWDKVLPKYLDIFGKLG